METTSTPFVKSCAAGLKAIAATFVMLLFLLIGQSFNIQAQIWEPEGLNLPGAWNEWTNPPVNNLALASSTQVENGRVTKYTAGITRWQTIFSVAENGADLVGGSYDWLFTSGPEGNPFQNKWAGVNVSMNTLQEYEYNTGSDNNVALTNNKWYTIVWEDNAYNASRAIFMETGAEPVIIGSVSVPAGTVQPGQDVMITVTLNKAKSAEEIIYLRYTNDNWNTSELIAVNVSGSTGTADIPGQTEGSLVEYYAFSSTVAGITSEYELYTIRFNNNEGSNYHFTVEGSGVSQIGWANLQWPGSGTIEAGQEFNIYGRVWVAGITGGANPADGLQAWLGYSTSNTNPETWTNWINASHHGPAGNNDEFVADLGAALNEVGTYYYAYRFKYLDQDFVYGGFSQSGGGFWDGNSNISGVLNIVDDIVYYPVSFTVLDSTGIYNNIKFKGEMTNWEPVDMLQNGNSWTLSIDILPGTYEWGVFEDDGSEWGIWLIEGDNLVVTVANDGSITGTTAYTVLYTSVPELSVSTGIYPNPTSGHLIIEISDAAHRFEYTLFGFSGSLLMNGQIGHERQTLDLSGLKPGVYILRLSDGNSLVVKRIVKH